MFTWTATRRTTANFVAFLQEVESWINPAVQRVYAIHVDLSPCLKAGDSWAEHRGPGMLARRQNAVTG